MNRLIVSLVIVIILAGGARATIAGKMSSRTPSAKRPNILLITLDTMRQDAIGCYRDPKKEYASIGWKPGMPSATPTLDALCAKGRKFTRAYTTAPITLPAHASILTGLYPTRHGIHDNGIYTLPKDVPTLPEILKKNGYQTAAAVSAIVLDRHYGLNRGFDQYDDQLGPRESGLQLEERKAKQTVDAALKLMAGMKKGKPWFFMLHLYDPHNDYQAPEPFKSKFPPYLAEVAYMDHELGRFLETMKKNGQVDDGTLIVATGDHGESLGEHGEATHGIFLYEATLKVPLIVAGQGIKSGEDQLTLVTHTDIVPSVLKLSSVMQHFDRESFLINVTYPGEKIKPIKKFDYHFDGMPLPVVEPTLDRSEAGTIFAESELGSNSYHWAPLYALLKQDQLSLNGMDQGVNKYIEAPKPEFYFLDSRRINYDPLEANNKYSTLDDRTKRDYRYQLSARHASSRKSTQSENPETRKALMQLGYVSGPSQANDDLPRPDPKEVIHLLPIFDKARVQAQKGQCQQVIPQLQDILKQNPGNVPVMAQLGWCQIELKNPRAAIPIYASAIKLNPTQELLHFQLGSALKQIDDPAGAEREWKAALALNPRYAPAAASLIQSARLAGRTAEAEKSLAAARKAQLEDSELEGEAGMLAIARKDTPAAEKAFAAALRLDPRNVSARVNLANILYGRKRIPETLDLYAQGIALLPHRGEFLLPAAAILLNECPDARVCPGAAQAARYFRQYLERNPGASDAPQVREILGDLEAARR